MSAPMTDRTAEPDPFRCGDCGQFLPRGMFYQCADCELSELRREYKAEIFADLAHQGLL